jgi:YHS domain-containing protein/thiol-disulfide isomerase/thioredoxin
MTRLSFTSAFIAVALLALARLGFGQETVAWMTDLQAAQSAATRQGKLLLVHFYADDCPPCKTLEKNVFSQSDIAASISRNYVPVKVHVDSRPELATRFHVQAWPTDLILNPAGLEVYRTVSPQSAAQYLAMLDQIAFQSGVGAGRPATNPLEQAPWLKERRTDVALTGATAPATPSAGPTASNQFAPQGLTTQPPYSEYTVGGAPGPSMPPASGGYRPQSPAADPYGSQEMRRGQAAPYRGNPPLQDDRWAGLSGAQGPAAAPPAAEESIYAPTPRNDAGVAPAPSIAQPDSRWAPHPSNPQTLAPSRSVYDQGFSQPSSPHVAPQNPQQVARQIPPQLPPSIPPQRPVQQSYVPPAATAQRTSAQFPAPRMVEASKAPPLSLDGFCPVTILETGKWHKGNIRCGAIHRGRTYWFASEDAQRKFLTDPDRYAPVLSGCDPVIFAESNVLVSGKNSIGLLLPDGKTVFFASEQSLARFKLAQQAYLGRAYQAMAAGDLPLR